MVDMASDQWYAWIVNKHEEIFGSQRVQRVPRLTGLLSVVFWREKEWFVCLFWLPTPPTPLGMTVDQDALFLSFKKLKFILAVILRRYQQTDTSVFLLFESWLQGFLKNPWGPEVQGCLCRMFSHLFIGLGRVWFWLYFLHLGLAQLCLSSLTAKMF